MSAVSAADPMIRKQLQALQRDFPQRFQVVEVSRAEAEKARKLGAGPLVRWALHRGELRTAPVGDRCGPQPVTGSTCAWPFTRLTFEDMG
ncbi:hypothetical protein ACW9HH_22780 [Nocardia gipuzkoensis]